MTTKAFVDYLTITGRPAVLSHLRGLARMGAKLDVRDSDWVWNDPTFKALFEKEFTLRRHQALVERFTQLLDEHVGISITGDKPDTCYKAICADFGLSAINAMCEGEVKKFVAHLNFCTSSGHFFELRERRNGMFRYEESADLLCNDVVVGKVAWGAANMGWMVSFTGDGCKAVNFKQFHAVFKDCAQAKLLKITRCDLAVDDYKGQFGVYDMRDKYEEGLYFANRGARPGWQMIEGGGVIWNKETSRWNRTTTAGATFYVGNRKNGKIARSYEKGKQLAGTCEEANLYPDWVRHEVEYHSTDRVLPWDMLVKCDDYFAGAYGAFARILPDVETPTRVATYQKETAVDTVRIKEAARVAYGPLVNYLREVHGLNNDQIIHELTRGHAWDKFPRRLRRVLVTPVPPEPDFGSLPFPADYQPQTTERSRYVYDRH
ncbi:MULTISPECIES: replication initiation factor domain-containing protein [Gammaproteobacteria]|uniref:replication initiation factor domain-containing protein n=1 Tax=Gammaproteobacteria TaxID=1236 RepID=UPI003A9022FD